MSKLVRINEKTLITLNEIAAQTGLSKQRLLDEAIDRLQREKLLEAANRAYKALQADPVAWAEEQKELTLWDVTLSDGLDDE